MNSPESRCCWIEPVKINIKNDPFICIQLIPEIEAMESISAHIAPCHVDGKKIPPPDKAGMVRIVQTEHVIPHDFPLCNMPKLIMRGRKPITDGIKVAGMAYPFIQQGPLSVTRKGIFDNMSA